MHGEARHTAPFVLGWTLRQLLTVCLSRPLLLGWMAGQGNAVREIVK